MVKETKSKAVANKASATKTGSKTAVKKTAKPAKKTPNKPVKKTAKKRGAVLSKSDPANPKKKMTKAQIFDFFSTLHADNPEPKGELESVNDFTFMVAVVLSAQATDIGVNKATRAFFKAADTPEQMLALGIEGIERYIKTIGLYHSKAKNVMGLCQMMLDDFGGEMPNTREELEKLPGVGRKTANVVMNIVFGAPTIAVDTHLFRLGNRTGLASGTTPLAVEKELERVIPKEFLLHAHHWLILQGRYICKARKPECHRCLVTSSCLYGAKNLEV